MTQVLISWSAERRRIRTYDDTFDLFTASARKSFAIKAVYPEMNGFDIHPDPWHFSFFGYAKNRAESSHPNATPARWWFQSVVARLRVKMKQPFAMPSHTAKVDPKGERLLKRGVAAEAHGDWGKALTFYTKVTQRYPGTIAAEDADTRIRALREQGKVV